MDYDKRERFAVDHVKRAALYTRVSHEEQKKEGVSLDAQMDTLEKYAKAHAYKIVGKYTDAGFSAAKHWETRKDGLVPLIEAVQRDEIDVVLFTKLDRWTRDPKYYYQLQSILDAHSTSWECVEEDYETVSTYGEFKVNLMLAISKQEASRTGDRIRSSNKYLVSQGYITTGAIPWGYVKENKEHKKRLLKDPELIDIVPEMFDCFLKHHSIAEVRRHMAKLGHDWPTETWRARLVHTMYTGQYRDNPTYCEPYISMETHEKVMAILDGNKNVKSASSGRIYLFSTLIECPYCGHNMVGAGTAHKGTEYPYYRCYRHYKTGCPMSRRVREDRLEKWLLEHLEKEFKLDKKLKVKAKKPKPKKRKTIDYQARINRLREMYVRDDSMTYDDYKEKLDALQEKLNEQEKELNKEDITPAQIAQTERLMDGFREAYDNLDQMHKRMFWHAVIKRIYVNGMGDVERLEFNY